MMQCETCGSKLSSVRLIRAYSPTLPSVIVDGLEQATCPNCGDAGVVYPRAVELSALVVGGILAKPSRLASNEIVFLRGALGMRAVELAEVLGITPAQVSRWETGAMPISALADRLLRMLVASKRGLPAPDLAKIDSKRVEPVSMRLELGRRGWKVVASSAKVAA